MERHVAVASFVALSSFGLLFTPAARAQTPSEIAIAKQWFSDGLAREEKGEFAPALDLFRRTVQIKKTPQIVYHVGFCESRTGALVEAMVDLDTAANLGRAAHATDVVTAALAELADVKKRVPTLEVRVAGEASPAKFVVDGSPIALSMLRTPLPLDPGEHTVTIEFASGTSATQKAALAEHEAKTLDVAAPRPSPAAQTPPPAPVPTAPPAAIPATGPVAEHRSRTLEWVLIGAGAALAVGGATVFAIARVKEASLHGDCPSRVNCDPSLEGTYNTAVTLNSTGIGVGIAGLAAVVVGGSMFAARPSSPATTAIVIGPGSVGFVGSFQ